MLLLVFLWSRYYIQLNACTDGVLWEDFQGYKQLTLENHLLFLLQAESHSMKNQQMDPFTRRQCKPTIVSNVSVILQRNSNQCNSKVGRKMFVFIPNCAICYQHSRCQGEMQLSEILVSLSQEKEKAVFFFSAKCGGHKRCGYILWFRLLQ